MIDDVLCQNESFLNEKNMDENLSNNGLIPNQIAKAIVNRFSFEGDIVVSQLASTNTITPKIIP